MLQSSGPGEGGEGGWRAGGHEARRWGPAVWATRVAPPPPQGGRGSRRALVAGAGGRGAVLIEACSRPTGAFNGK